MDQQPDLLDPSVAVVDLIPSDHFGAAGDTSVFEAMPASEKRRLLVDIAARMATEEQPEDIAEALGRPVELILALQRDVRESYKPVLCRRPAEDVYVDYVLSRRGEIKELNDLISSLQVEVTTDESIPDAINAGETPITPPESAPAMKRKTSVVSLDPKTRLGAIKRKGEIRNEIFEKGQELGLIYKAPERKQVVNGFVVAELSNQELQRELLKELRAVEDLMQIYGDKDILGNPISR